MLLCHKYDFIEETIMHYRKGHSSAMNDLKGLEYGYHYIFNFIKFVPQETLVFCPEHKLIAAKFIAFC